MKALKNCLIIAITLIGLTSLSSCQSEEEMERRIVEGFCWEGVLPIYSYNDYYSRFFFDEDGSGVEEVYINGEYNGEYPFTWGWMDDSYAVLLLKYRSRWDVTYTCIDVLEVSHTRLRGYFYEDIDDYYLDRSYGFPDRDNLYFTLRSTGDSRYNRY